MIRDVVTIQLRRVRAHLIVEPEPTLIDCGYAASVPQIREAIEAQGHAVEKAGAGLIAVEGGTPIVPVKLKIHSMSIIDKRRLPARLRGDVELVVGEPIWFDSTMDHAAATTRLEAAVAAL